jgi:hypothetical protein
MTLRRLLIGALAALAFAQTMAYFVYLRDDPGNYNSAGAGGDQVAYIELAQQILHGTWQGAAHYMPGLPAVIAVSQLVVGDPRLGIAVLQGFVYALLVIFAARIAAAAFGEQSAVWAAAGVGLNPALGYYAAQALTEFLTAVVLFGLVAAIAAWARTPGWAQAALAGALIALAGFLRAEYLGLVVVFVAIVLWFARRQPRVALTHAGVLLAIVVLAITPWVVRNSIVTGRATLYNESPFSNLLLMATWFRVFDEQTFTQLQQIETAPGAREQAIEQARTVGPRPELSVRYIEQARGPYERPLPETLELALGNVRLNPRQYLVNHVVLAPVLIWAGHTPVRQADVPRLPSSARYAIWGSELALLLVALWQAARGLGVVGRGAASDSSVAALSLSFLGVVLFLTLVHVVIAVDDRFTTPALPLIGLFAGACVAGLVRARERVAVRYAPR